MEHHQNCSFLADLEQRFEPWSIQQCVQQICSVDVLVNGYLHLLDHISQDLLKAWTTHTHTVTHTQSHPHTPSHPHKRTYTDIREHQEDYENGMGEKFVM